MGSSWGKQIEYMCIFCYSQNIFLKSCCKQNKNNFASRARATCLMQNCFYSVLQELKQINALFKSFTFLNTLLNPNKHYSETPFVLSFCPLLTTSYHSIDLCYFIFIIYGNKWDTSFHKRSKNLILYKLFPFKQRKIP